MRARFLTAQRPTARWRAGSPASPAARARLASPRAPSRRFPARPRPISTPSHPFVPPLARALPPQRLQARQEEALVQPGGADVRPRRARQVRQRRRGSIDDTALNIYEATERSFSVDVPVELRDSALEYELKLYNGSTVRALIYLVYAEPLSSVPGGGSRAKPVAANGADHLIGAGHTWLPVTRARCAKGCTGPILSAIQRFGKQGRTQKGAAGKEEAKPDSGEKWKDARNLFISIDEASNHVCAFGPNKCKVFRYARRTGTRATRSREYRRHQGPEDAPGGDCVAGAAGFRSNGQ